MAPAVGLDSTPAFSRSYSSPDLANLQSDPTSDRSDTTGLSFFEVPSFDSTPGFDAKLLFDAQKPDSPSSEAKIGVTVAVKPAQADLERPEKRARRYSLVERPKSWLPTSKSASSLQEYLLDRPSTQSGTERTTTDGLMLATGSDSGLVREVDVGTVSAKEDSDPARMSLISQRPPLPQSSRVGSAGEKPASKFDAKPLSSAKSSAKRSFLSRPLTVGDPDIPRPADDSKGTSRTLNRASSYFTKMRSRPQSALVKLSYSRNSSSNNSISNDSDTSCSSSATSLALPVTTFTIEHQGTLKTASFVDGSTTSADDSCADMAPCRDPLWKPFKALDSESGKFSSRDMIQRMELVRAALLPFLRAHTNHTSNTKSLLPEHVEYRANVLDRWWKGLLEMLDGSGHQPLPGADRPVLLNIIIAVMMRPEWRRGASYMMPLADRSPNERVRTRPRSLSSGSNDSNQAGLAVTSAEHNVRAMFTANLLRQMDIVVRRMGQRHAPLSLVDFSGKTCAYAFFFAPGVAEMLVRAWRLTPDLMRRVAREFGLPEKDTGESEDIVALFPPTLGMLGWTDTKTMLDRLRVEPKLSMAAARIRWYGPWLMRWVGRDTDLFFVFCKYFHILSDEFTPPGLPLVEKTRSPAFALVHAQLLSALDWTIHRPMDEGGLMPTAPSYDSAYGVDTFMPLGAVTGARPDMTTSQNRLVALLKDFLAEDSPHVHGARHTFAEAFMAVLRAATVRISLFDIGACCVLCDFLEEALVAYDQFEDADGRPNVTYIDWSFWFDVCKKMLGTLNSSMEVRLFSFVFATWDAMAADPRRKQKVCLEWLLEEKNFNDYFNHWNPLVRAYFMRLLCWRVCRDTGSANEVDAKIFLTVATRLKSTWAHYLYMKETAEQAGKFPPSTAPCLPTPGKKFMIIRTEVQPHQAGLFMNFDSFLQPLHASDPSLSGLFGTGTNPSPPSDAKRRWSLLGKVLSLTSGSSAGDTPASRGLLESNVEQAGTNSGNSLGRYPPSSAPLPPPKPPSSATSDGSSTGSAPVYSEPQYVFKFTLGVQVTQPNQLRQWTLVRPRLPRMAQAWVNARSRSGSDPPPPAPRIPAPTRRVSGLREGGLISEARNASPLSSPTRTPTSHRASTETPPQLSFSPSFTRSLNEPLDCDTSVLTKETRGSDDSATPSSAPSRATKDSAPAGDADSGRSTVDTLLLAVRPTGFYAKNAIYSGRALAEWNVIVAECNAFVDRRREEGILGLSEVEVPILGTEGMGLKRL
ncbi:hypothetical protein ACRALDRAFT_1061927 [Sodiomyces alcalophilus JCM 7366]|uniref:uncharacterized protein n=1 Tax=Sodiomyces alcalophilus JCM 7366 TaxID=591952 RepID=UPI0039B3C8DE